MEVEMQTPTMGEETPMMAPEEDTKAQEKL